MVQSPHYLGLLGKRYFIMESTGFPGTTLSNSPINLAELLSVIDSSKHQCLFIKNAQSNYLYANDNFLSLVGLDNLSQLRHTSDAQLFTSKQQVYKYKALINWVVEEKESLNVQEIVSPTRNPSFSMRMPGKLYPLFAESGNVQSVMGIILPETKLLKLDWDTVFNLTTKELDSLLKPKYIIKLSTGSLVLSKREIQVLIQLIKGSNAGEIASTLGIKQTTVESYLVNIRNKLNVGGRSELINFIIHEQLLQKIII